MVANGKQIMLHVSFLLSRYAPRKKFMKLKDFETPFDEAPPIMDLLILKDRPLPVLCVVCQISHFKAHCANRSAFVRVPRVTRNRVQSL